MTNMHDLRRDALFDEAVRLCEAIRRPGTTAISEASELELAPDGNALLFVGAVVDTLEDEPATRICALDIQSGDVRILTNGPNNDRTAKIAPDGRRAAFLSDRGRSGDYQLYFLDLADGVIAPGPRVDGWIEYCHWSPDGEMLLLGVAGHGADRSGGQGAMTSTRAGGPDNGWMPSIDAGDEPFHRRALWLYRTETGRAEPLAGVEENIWEANWCGRDAIVAITSPGPREGDWYDARLVRITLADGAAQLLYTPARQLGCPLSSPSGRHIVVLEALCSDRGLIAGAVRLFDAGDGGKNATTLDLGGVDATWLGWAGETMLVVAGQRGLDTVIGCYDLSTRHFEHLWSGRERTAAGRLAAATCAADGRIGLIAEGFASAPAIMTIERGGARTLASFDLGYEAEVSSILREARPLRWDAPDGTPIEGWLLLPKGDCPHPLVTVVHGGPVNHWRGLWLARARTLPLLMLLARGHAIFLPNPRGSSGRGPAFAEAVLGDMGGADVQDILSGIDSLVADGIADPARLGVTGISYGGYMSAWLITQTSRFRAAVPVAPVTNHLTERLLSNIPEFVGMFVDGNPADPHSQYVSRSPVYFAANVTTPVLTICGAADRCTPPEEGAQFHAAVRARGVESVLATYPGEGHGVRAWPAANDYAARLVGWFERHFEERSA